MREISAFSPSYPPVKMSVVSASQPLLRLTRAIVFATVCLIVSVGGHVYAGGKPPATEMVVLAGLGATAVAYLLNGRERGPQVVLSATVGVQFVLHELFDRATTATTATSATSAGLLHQHGDLTFGMTLIHIVVAVLTGWWLYRGESAVWLMLRLWGKTILPIPRLLCPAVVAPARIRPEYPGDEPEPSAGDIVAAVHHRRGPPVPGTAG
jgi:hypothetical protein